MRFSILYCFVLSAIELALYIQTVLLLWCVLVYCKFVQYQVLFSIIFDIKLKPLILVLLNFDKNNASINGGVRRQFAG